MNSATLLVERVSASTAVMTLNRPDVRNALNIELMQGICGGLENLAQDPACRIVILQGAGPAFCAGLDLAEARDVAVAEQSAAWVARLLASISASPLVSIAAAHGAAYAGGAGLMSACDLVVASADLRVCFPEVRRGLVPALVATLLRHRLRDSELRELMLLAEPIDAQRAGQLGLVQRVVPASEALAEALRIADSLLQGGPQAVRMTKRLLHEIQDTGNTNPFDRALELHAQARRSAEAHEGIAAFHERRRPIW